MDAEQIEVSLSNKTVALSLSGGLDYLFFIKPDDGGESDCLRAFVKANNLAGRFIDISTDDGFMAAQELGVLECDAPCTYSTKQLYVIYQGCPESMEYLAV